MTVATDVMPGEAHANTVLGGGRTQGSSGDGSPPRPFRLAMLVPTLLVSVAAPIAILKGLEALGVTPLWALAAGCVPPGLNNLIGWIRTRRLDPVGIVMVASMAGGPVASLISGKIAFRIAADCLLGVAWGSAFLGSLLLRRPVLFYLIRSMTAGDDASRIESWNGLWRHAAFRATLRWTTAMWGLFYLAGILIELTLYRLLPVDTVVTIGAPMNLVLTVALVLITRWRMRAMRTRLERRQGLKWPL